MTRHGMNRYRLFKQLWNNRYPVRVWGKDVIPPVIKEKGINVVDPTVTTISEPPAWEPPVPDDPRFARYYPPKDPSTHPNYHEKPAMLFTYPGQLLTGLKQAQIVTNTVVYSKLPTMVTEPASSLGNDIDNLVHRVILQANKWFPGKDRLPKHYWPDFPKFKLRSEKGILHHDSLRMLVHNLIHLCTTQSAQKDLSMLLKRRILFDPQIVGSYNLTNSAGETRRVVVRGSHAAALSTTDPLPTFSNVEEVKKTGAANLPDLGPISPFIDLQKEQIYPNDSTGWMQVDQPVKAINAARYPHTLFLYNKETLWTQEDFEREPWNNEQRDARALLFIHAWCVSYAKQLYGQNVVALPKPVTAQCVQTDGQKFRFLCYQLNVVDSDHRNPTVRNQAWIDQNDDENALFVKTIEPKQFSRQASYSDYEPAALSRFVTFFLNGTNGKALTA